VGAGGSRHKGTLLSFQRLPFPKFCPWGGPCRPVLARGERGKAAALGVPEGPSPRPSNVTELGAGLPRACHRRDGCVTSGTRGSATEGETAADAPERAGARGPATMALTPALQSRTPQPDGEQMARPCWPPPTPPRQHHSTQCAGAPAPERVGGAKGRKCPSMRAFPGNPPSGSSWRTRVKAQPRVAGQPERAPLTASAISGASRV
jgi:hypothetical protein